MRSSNKKKNPMKSYSFFYLNFFYIIGNELGDHGTR